MSTPTSPMLPSPFSDQPADLKWVPNPELDRRLAKLRKRFGGMGVAVVDLTYSSPNPKYTGWLAFSGWNVTRQFNTDSMTKICAMYAAYQLRWSLTRAAAA